MTATILGRNKVLTYRCGSYVGHGREACSTHAIREEVLEQAVLSDIHRFAKLAVEDRDALIERIIRHRQGTKQTDTASIQKKIDIAEARIAVLQNAVCNLYTDKTLGNLPESMCFAMMKQYQDEIDTLLGSLPEWKAQCHEISTTLSDVEQWSALISDYLQLHSLTRSLARSLIDKIIVSEKNTSDAQSFQDITILYKFVGDLSQLAGKTKDVA